MKEYLKSYDIRHALSVTFAVLLSMVASHYFFKSIFAPLGALLVSPVTRGATLRQSIIFFSIIIAALAVQTAMYFYWQGDFIEGIVLSGYLVSAYVVYRYQTISYKNFMIVMLFVLILIISSLSSHFSMELMRNEILAVMTGGGIAVLMSQFIFPVNLSNEFRYGVIPVLYAAKHYSLGITSYLLKGETSPVVLNAKRTQLENTLANKKSIYPEWAYELGFNPGLRSGFRFFLIHLEQLCEMLFASNDLIKCHVDQDHILSLRASIQQVTEYNEKLIMILIHYMENNVLTDTPANYMDDILSLEKALKGVIPGNLALLDFLPEYIALIAFVRSLKNQRKLLLQLALSISK